MFYLPLALVTWLSASWMVDRQRLWELLPYGLFGGVLATIQDRLVLVYRLWEYRDIGPVADHHEIALLISLSAAPLFGMRFVQGLRPGEGAPWRRIFRYSLIAMVPEVIAYLTGNIAYHNGWNLLWSGAAYPPIWLAFWAFHRWFAAVPAHKQAPGR